MLLFITMYGCMETYTTKNHDSNMTCHAHCGVAPYPLLSKPLSLISNLDGMVYRQAVWTRHLAFFACLPQPAGAHQERDSSFAYLNPFISIWFPLKPYLSIWYVIERPSDSCVGEKVHSSGSL